MIGEFKIPTSRKYTRENGSVFITVPPNLEGVSDQGNPNTAQSKRVDFWMLHLFMSLLSEQINVDESNAISIDLGLNNLATVVSTTNESFLIDGLWLKSKNQWFNKRRAKLVHHKDKQGIKHLTKQEAWLSYRRKNQVNDYSEQVC